MADTNPQIWNNPSTQQLTDVLVAMSEAKTMQNFLRDVMTESEILEISARLEAARLLESGTKYTKITETTKLSSRTIARISDWKSNGTSGYAAALNLINHHASSTTRTGEA